MRMVKRKDKSAKRGQWEPTDDNGCQINGIAVWMLFLANFASGQGRVCLLNFLKLNFMGTIKKGILGDFSGKVGNVVGATWNGIGYMRSLPTKVRNPRTPGQLEQRMKFSMIGSLMKNLAPVLQIGYKNAASGKGRSTFSMAMSDNLKGAITGEYPDLTIDYPNVRLAKGLLSGCSSVSLSLTDGMADFSWDNIIMGNAAETDRVMVVAINTATGEMVYDRNLAGRSEMSGSIALPANWAGDEAAGYVIFVNEEESENSDSIFAGSITGTAA